MKMIKICICEDDQQYGMTLTMKIKQYFRELGVNADTTLYSSISDKILSDNLNTDIFYLDIEIGKKNGIIFADKIRKVIPNASIVFITSYIKYSPQGYHVNALRYILKNDPGVNNMIRESVSAFYRNRKKKANIIPLNAKGGLTNIDLNKLIYIESRKHYLYYFCKDRVTEIAIRGKLDNIEINPVYKQFIRIHQSYLVNHRFISSITRTEIALTCGYNLPISKGRYNDVLNKYMILCREDA